jgi:hypothetical protein
LHFIPAHIPALLEKLRRLHGSFQDNMLIIVINDGSTFPGKPIEELRYFVRNGAKYFVPLKGYIEGDRGETKAYLDAHFQKLDIPGGYSFYKLTSVP